MKRTVLILLLTLACAVPLLAQTKTDKKVLKCTLPVASAPELRGFRLGAPQAGVLSRFPGTSVPKPDKFGISQLRLTVIDAAAISKGLGSRDKSVQANTASGSDDESAFIIDGGKFPALKGVRSIRLRFLDGRLAYAQLGYDDSVKWNSIDQFVETVGKTLNLTEFWGLPPDSDGTGNTMELRCDGFILTADLGVDSSDTRIAAQLSIEDVGAEKLVEKRQNDLKEKAQRDEEAKRKNFKP